MSAEQVRWSTRIALAKQRGRFNKSDWRDATSWQGHDAVAEHAPDCERDGAGTPLDTTLRELGIDFSLAVKADDFAQARKVNDAIESYARSLHVA